MKYKVLYDTLINKEHKSKDSEIEFAEGTDEGYIKRLISNKVIVPIEEEKQEHKPTPRNKKEG